VRWLDAPDARQLVGGAIRVMDPHRLRRGDA
jgi:hypothetical protein